MTVWSEVAVTVSRNDTTGSDTLICAPPMKSSCRSFRQISRCSSPAPAMMCSPVSSMWHWTMGSERDRRLRPSTSLGRSDATLGSTATRTTGDTENFIAFIGNASALSSLVSVAVLAMNWSRPTSAQVLPHGTSSTASCLRPMQSTVLLLARDVVGAHDADLGAGGNAASEHAAERKKAPRVRRGNHLGDVHHEWAVRVAVADRRGVHVVERALVQRVHAVLLSLGRRRQVVHNHLQQCDRRGKPGLHNTLHQRLSHQLLVVGLELGQYAQLLEHWEQLVLVVIHGQVDHLLDGLVAELVEAPLA
eukprot:363205-Chlamydomonas_euryale.AAC.20